MAKSESGRLERFCRAYLRTMDPERAALEAERETIRSGLSELEELKAQLKEEQEELAARIIQAGKLLPAVTIDDKLLETVAKLAVELGVDGHRADITVIKTALTVAAFNGRAEVELEDLKQAAKLVLPHRMRRRPFEEGQLDWDKVESFLAAEA